MRVLIKPFIWLLTGISTLLLVLLVLLFLVDVNLYRAQIEKQVSVAFGRKVFFDGPLTLEPSFTPRFSVQGLRINNPRWASRTNLATVDKFDIRVSLLPLLMDGKLEIISLDFHGVDLLLEKSTNGLNNFTFNRSDGSGVLPAISQMSLYDINIAYRAPGANTKRFHMERATARKVPNEPVQVQLHTTIKKQPVKIIIRGERLNGLPDNKAWDVFLTIASENLSIDISANNQSLETWESGQFRLELKGEDLQQFGKLFEYELPDLGPYELSTNVQYNIEESLKLTDLTGLIGSSDFHGQLNWDFYAPRDAIRIRLESQKLDISKLKLVEPQTEENPDSHLSVLNQPLDIHWLRAFDLDIDLQVQSLKGLKKTVKNVLLEAQSNYQQLNLQLNNINVEDIEFQANATLPWNLPVRTPVKEIVNLESLLKNAELQIKARMPEPGYQYYMSMLGQPIEISVSTLKATVLRDKGILLNAEAVVNDDKLNMQLQGDPLVELLRKPYGPWKDIMLAIRANGFRFDAKGSVTQPFESGGYDLLFSLEGTEAQTLLPLQSAYSINGHYMEQPGRRLIEDLKIQIASSDLSGHMYIDQRAKFPKVVARINSKKIVLNEIVQSESIESGTGFDWEQTLDIANIGLIDIDVALNMQSLQGLGKSIDNIKLALHTSSQNLTLQPFQALVDGTTIDARLQLPWGERLASKVRSKMTLLELVRLADVELKAHNFSAQNYFQSELMGQTLKLQPAELKVIVRPGDSVRVNASALLNDLPVTGAFQLDSLADMLQNPTGPWKDLTFEFRQNDFHIQAIGSVERPLDVAGIDLSFAASGNEIEAILPLYGLILPLRGAFSIAGHFTDHVDEMVFNNLKILLGKSDISGRISMKKKKNRPELIAKLFSEHIYLSELLPAQEGESPTENDSRLIPDYELPVSSLQAIDVDLSLYGKHLQTSAGELGDISFRARLTDGVLRIDPFKVRGFGHSLIDSHLVIDTSQDPPFCDLSWNANQVDMGVLLKDAGIAETVEGKIDMSLNLSGSGRTRRELMSSANGHLFIAGQDGRFGSRHLDLWGSDLLRTMLSPNWLARNVTVINCLIASINIDDGLAISDDLLLDTSRITIGAAGTLDLQSEQLNMVFAPRPKRTSLVSLSNPVHLTGTLTKPEVSVTRLPRSNRMAAAGTGLLAGLVNPGYLIFTFSQTGGGQSNSCAVALQRAKEMKDDRTVEAQNPEASSPSGISLFPGCTRRQ